MAESVDALVSNTNGCKAVPVRPRLWVPESLLRNQGALLLWTIKISGFRDTWHLPLRSQAAFRGKSAIVQQKSIPYRC